VAAPPALVPPRPGGPPGGEPALVPAQREDEAGRPRRPLLTERELQVLHGMADGKSNAEIGRDLFVSEDTVKTHARRLFRKLHARDRAHRGGRRLPFRPGQLKILISGPRTISGVSRRAPRPTTKSGPGRSVLGAALGQGVVHAVRVARAYSQVT